jgi:hypothetical protein
MAPAEQAGSPLAAAERVGSPLAAAERVGSLPAAAAAAAGGSPLPGPTEQAGSVPVEAVVG